MMQLNADDKEKLYEKLIKLTFKWLHHSRPILHIYSSGVPFKIDDDVKIFSVQKMMILN